MDSTQPNELACQQTGRFSWRRYDSDLVARAIQHEIDKASLGSFKVYHQLYNKIYVHPARANKGDTDSRGQSLGNLRYHFDVMGDISKPIYVKVSSDGQIRIYYLRRWTRVSQLMGDWVREPQLGDKAMSPIDKEVQWDLHGKWWRALGKPFRLLDLPLELRELIYSFALVRTSYPYLKARCRRLVAARRLEIAKGNPNVNLLHVSRQVHEEASHIMFRDALFLVEHKRVFHRMSFNTAFWDRIANLEIALRHDEYLQLFGVVEEEAVREEARERYQHNNIEAVRGLRYLRLTGLVIQILPARRVSPADGHDRACLKAVCDWIFRGVFTWVKGHPVKVKGWAKTRQKLQFEAKCEGARRQYLDWCTIKPLGYEEGLLTEWDEYMDQEDGGVRLDAEEKVDVEDCIDKDELLPEDWTRCACQPRCEFDTWGPEG